MTTTDNILSFSCVKRCLKPRESSPVGSAGVRNLTGRVLSGRVGSGRVGSAACYDKRQHFSAFFVFLMTQYRWNVVLPLQHVSFLFVYTYAVVGLFIGLHRFQFLWKNHSLGVLFYFPPQVMNFTKKMIRPHRSLDRRVGSGRMVFKSHGPDPSR